MFWFELLFQGRAHTQFDKAGSIQIRERGTNVRQPFFVVAIHSSIAGFLATFFFAMVYLSIPLPGLIAAPIAALLIAIYSFAGYYLRPEPNFDNMGWLGGGIDDPFQFRDDINRSLFGLQMLLAPGKYIGSTFIEVCTFLYLVPERTPETIAAEIEGKRAEREVGLRQRAAARFEGKPCGVVEMSSLKYLNPDEYPEVPRDPEPSA